ncbi:hypothetical protein HaLaN_21374 [Haematococcus lacustris]|uniref:Uncharacterized protein n=1 Tax=Haematococcus lacustris TaxID=44745 RepID=A0A699ZZ70_HAELA|nr:hypothetical protein HaLaN_21374 [Haematococcus lacustris]
MKSWARCEQLEVENEELRKQFEELKTRSLQQPFTARFPLVEHEVAMQRQRSPVINQTGPQPAARPPGGAAGPSRADQVSEQRHAQCDTTAAGCWTFKAL